MVYDVVVVGAGSAGSILATRLSEDPNRSVLLIEAGPDFPDFAELPSELKYGFATAAVPVFERYCWAFSGQGTLGAPPIVAYGGKVTGGGSAVNGQVFLRGAVEDYDLWAALGNDRWSYHEVLPYLCKLEEDRDFSDEYHGANGPISVARFAPESWTASHRAFRTACLEAGFQEFADANHPAATGVSPCPFNNIDGVRISTALRYLPAARDRENFTLWSDAQVRRVVVDNGRAIGVEVERDGETTVINGSEIVLSAGAIKSPHLLLLSGIGPAEQIRAAGVPLVHDLPGVGQNLQDHPWVGINWKIRPEYRPGQTDPRVQIVLRWTAVSSLVRNDLYAAAYVVGDDFTICVGLYAPVSRGEVRVSSDVHEAPLISWRFLEDDFDRRRMREAVRQIIKMEDSAAYLEAFAGRGVPSFGPPTFTAGPSKDELATDAALDEWLLHRANVGSGNHNAGTCKMGPASDSASVVDQFGRVHGIPNLRVADASIMPTVVRAPAHVTAMMIGERIADFFDEAADPRASSVVTGSQNVAPRA